MTNLWKAMTMAWQCAPWVLCRRVCYVLIQSMLPLLGVYWFKHLIDAVGATGDVADTPDSWALYLVAMVATFMLNRLVRTAEEVNGDLMEQRLIDHVTHLVQQQSARLDIDFYDHSAYYDTLHRAQREAGARPVSIVDCFLAVGGAVLSLAIVVAMLQKVSWWVAIVLVVAAVPSFIVRLHKAGMLYRYRRQNTPLVRRAAYYGSLLTERNAAQEVRAYRLASLFRQRYIEARQRIVASMLRISCLMGAADAVCAVVEAMALLVVVWIMAEQTVAGAISVGTMVMMVEAFRRGQGYMGRMVAGVAGLYDSRLFMSNLFEFLQLEPTILPPDEPLPLPATIESIELRNVTFRYPGMDSDVLSGYNMVARKGEVMRIEGENGRGKSTVVRLLLRLYDPQEGQVLINGIDIRNFQPNELRRCFGVLFQTFMRYQSTLSDNIAMGDIDNLHRDPLRAMLLSGTHRVAYKLPNGMSTRLGRMFEGGEELSMGQWQRVATARALHSDAPIVLLDEPLAWIDNEGRRHLEETIERIKHNKIIILITHT